MGIHAIGLGVGRQIAYGHRRRTANPNVKHSRLKFHAATYGNAALTGTTAFGVGSVVSHATHNPVAGMVAGTAAGWGLGGAIQHKLINPRYSVKLPKGQLHPVTHTSPQRFNQHYSRKERKV